MQRAEIIVAEKLLLADYLARHPQVAQFLQDMNAHYCGGGMVGTEGWHMTNEQYEFLLERRLI